MTNYDLEFLYEDDSRKEVERLIYDYYRTEPLQVLTVSGGLILPRIPPCREDKFTWMGRGGVVDSDGKYVELSGIKHINHDCYVFGGSYPIDYDDVLYLDEDVIYLGPMFNHWGHFIYEFITRLWFCLDHTDKRLAFCGWGFDSEGLYGSYLRLFELLGIDKSRLLDIRKPTRFKNVIIPEQCYLRRKYYTDEYIRLIDAVKSNIDITDMPTCDKIYFSRRSVKKTFFGWIREHGEEAIEKTFAQNGFDVVDPADLTLDQQIYCMEHCNTLAVVSSSTAADSVFMKENTNRIYLKKSFFMDDDLMQLDQLTKANSVVVIDSYYEPKKHYRASHPGGPHLIGASAPFLAFLSKYGMKPISCMEYYFWKMRCYLWFVFVSIYNRVFSVAYPVYYATIRNRLKERGKR